MNIVFMSMDTLPSTLWARDLYDQMHIRSDFRKWFPRMCQYGFIEGRDYEYFALHIKKFRFTVYALQKNISTEYPVPVCIQQGSLQNFVILNPAKSTASSSRTYPALVVITSRWENIWNRFFP